MNTISFCIPSKNNLRYLKTAISYIRKNCVSKSHEILVWVDKDEDGTSSYLSNLNDPNLKFFVNKEKEPYGIGNAYNFLVENASNDLVMMFHADMIVAEGFDEEILKHHMKGVVVAGTRIEPPLHPNEPCKITEDFGLWPEADVSDGFNESKFNLAVKSYKDMYKNKTTYGMFAPWLIHKDDYNTLQGHDPILNSLAEDNDIFNRMVLNNFNLVQTWEALVYHLTCRGGQFEHANTTEDLKNKSSDWNQLSYTKTREFIRKWGYSPMSGPLKEPIVWPVVRVHLESTGWNSSQEAYALLQFLEPYFSSLNIDDEKLVNLYVTNEKKYTLTDLQKKFTKEPVETIKLKFNIQQLQQQHINDFLLKLPLILSEVEAGSSYEYDIFTITT